jgi:hypothetical protein
MTKLRFRKIHIPEDLKAPHSHQHWWLTPIILATQEAEIRRIAVQSQPWANGARDPNLEKPII